MKFCIALAYNDTRELPELCRVAEESGFSAAILSDHLVYPAVLETPYPYTRDGQPRWEHDTPWPDPIVTAAALAMVTERLQFITSIFVLPTRHPVLAAKSISTAAVLSDNRLILGVGAGWMREEFDLVGQPFEARGRRMNESIDVMRKLWTGEPVAHAGDFYRFDAVQMRPVPEAAIPIWAGGHAAAALRRATHLCDGWLSEVQTSEEMRSIAKRLHRLRASSPRRNEPFHICAAVTDAFTLDGYQEMADLGVTHLITVPWLFYGQPESLQEKCDGIRRFGETVLANLEASG